MTGEWILRVTLRQYQMRVTKHTIFPQSFHVVWCVNLSLSHGSKRLG